MPIINKQDIVSEDALRVPYELGQGFKSETIPALEASAKSMLNFYNTAGNTQSLRKLQDELDKLNKEQEKLVGVQKLMHDKIVQLEKDNKKLAEQLDKTTKETKQNTEASQKNANALEAMDNRMNGVIGRAKQLGKELLALAKSPIILALGVIIGLLAAAGSAVKTFFTATGEGEDMLARQTSVWNQFFALLKDKWANLGKQVADTFGESGLQITLFRFLSLFSEKWAVEFLLASNQAKALADTIDEIEEAMARNIVTRAQTNLKYNELILKSQDDLKYSDQERLSMLEQAIELKRQQLEIDLTLAKQSAEATLYQIGLAHNLTKEQVDRMTLEEKYAKFTGEEMKKLAEVTAHVIDLEANYAAEVKKAAAKVLALKELIHKKEVKEIMDRAEAERQVEADRLREYVQAERNKVLAGEQTKEQADKKIEQMEKAHLARLTELQIEQLKKILQLSILTAEEKAEITKKLHELEVQLQEQTYAAFVEFQAVEVEAGMSKLESLSNAYGNFANGISSIFSTLTENRLRQIDEEDAALEASFEKRIALAGDNIEKRKKLENEFERKRQEIERKRVEALRRAAIFEKGVAFIQAGINVALAATNQGAKGDPYTALARIAAVVAALGPFVALIASKDIPSYAVGTDDHPGGLARVGEEGIELYRTPKGKWGLTPNGESLMNLEKGTEVFTNKDTMRMLAMAAAGSRDSVVLSKADEAVIDLGKKMDSVVHAIKNQEKVKIEYSAAGAELSLLRTYEKLKFKNNFFR